MAAESDALASAERIVQLEQDLAEAKEQLTATNEVLAVIGRSDFRLEPVFETVVRHATRLCRADCGYVYQPDGDVFRIAFMLGGTPEYREYMQRASGPAGAGDARRPGRARAPNRADPGRARGPRISVADRARARGLPHDARRADARGRPSRGRTDAVAARGRSVRRPHDRPPQHACCASGGRDPERRAIPARRDQPGRVAPRSTSTRCSRRSSPAPRSCPAPREARSSSTTGDPGYSRCAPASGRIPV